MTPEPAGVVANARVREPGLRAWQSLERDLLQVGVLVARPDSALVETAELEALPPAARAWMRFFGVRAGQAKGGSFRTCWTLSGGHVHPLGGRAIWELAGGPFAYADFRVVREALAYDLPLRVPAL
jgi:hypothetical protein